MGLVGDPWGKAAKIGIVFFRYCTFYYPAHHHDMLYQSQL